MSLSVYDFDLYNDEGDELPGGHGWFVENSSDSDQSSYGEDDENEIRNSPHQMRTELHFPGSSASMGPNIDVSRYLWRRKFTAISGSTKGKKCSRRVRRICAPWKPSVCRRLWRMRERWSRPTTYFWDLRRMAGFYCPTQCKLPNILGFFPYVENFVIVSIDWSIDWLIGHSAVCLIVRLIDWLFERSFVRLIDWLIDFCCTFCLLCSHVSFVSSPLISGWNGILSSAVRHSLSNSLLDFPTLQKSHENRPQLHDLPGRPHSSSERFLVSQMHREPVVGRRHTSGRAGLLGQQRLPPGRGLAGGRQRHRPSFRRWISRNACEFSHVRRHIQCPHEPRDLSPHFAPHHHALRRAAPAVSPGGGRSPGEGGTEFGGFFFPRDRFPLLGAKIRSQAQIPGGWRDWECLRGDADDCDRCEWCRHLGNFQSWWLSSYWLFWSTDLFPSISEYSAPPRSAENCRSRSPDGGFWLGSFDVQIHSASVGLIGLIYWLFVSFSTISPCGWLIDWSIRFSVWSRLIDWLIDWLGFLVWSRLIDWLIRFSVWSRLIDWVDDP